MHGLPLVVLPFPSPSSFSMRWFLVLKVKLNLLSSFSRKIAECTVSNYVYLQFDGGFFWRMVTSGSSTQTRGGKLVGGRGVEDSRDVAVPGSSCSGFNRGSFAARGGSGISGRP